MCIWHFSFRNLCTHAIEKCQKIRPNKFFKSSIVIKLTMMRQYTRKKKRKNREFLGKKENEWNVVQKTEFETIQSKLIVVVQYPFSCTKYILKRSNGKSKKITVIKTPSFIIFFFIFTFFYVYWQQQNITINHAACFYWSCVYVCCCMRTLNVRYVLSIWTAA